VPSISTRIQSFAQVTFCKGCCCGRVDRGKPPFPEQRLKALWKAERLNRHVQLTVSGCLGPCDLVNVALVTTPDGQHWFGGLATDSDYDLIVAWARASAGAGRAVPFSAALEAFSFNRWSREDSKCDASCPEAGARVLA